MHGFRIGRLFGIEIRLDWRWLFIFVLLTWNLSTVFSGWHRDWPPFEPFAVALVASLLFVGCILATIARALPRGRRVRSATRSVPRGLRPGFIADLTRSRAS